MRVGRVAAWACVFIVTLLAVGWNVVQWYDTASLHRLVRQLPRFGPERGVYSFTVVTGLYDIGRGKWLKQSRTYNQYLKYLLQVLRLDVNLVVFIEPKGATFVRQARQGRESRTAVIESRLDDLPCYKDLERVTEIMKSERFRAENINWKTGKVEGTVPVYNVVTNSKAGLMQRAVQLNPFHTHFFIWLDAGMGHGKPGIFPPDGVWNPRHLLAVPHRVTFVTFGPMDSYRNVRQLHTTDVAPMAGGLFAGGTTALLRFCHLHQQAWTEMLQENVVDDDQNTFTRAYFKDPNNFNPVPGEWYGLIQPWT